jgi:hypothetical protein
MKHFTVNIGGETRTIPGPDDATQEDAQAEAEKQFAASQAADVQRDFSGETGRQGISNPLTGKPTGILGGDFGAAVGRKAANFAQGGAELVGGPMQLLGMKPGPLYQQAEKTPTTTGDKIARFAGASLPLAGLGGAAPFAVGAVEGASAPASSNTQRLLNAGVGAVGAKIPGMSEKTAGALDHLVGTGLGGLLGHGTGGTLGGLATLWGAKLGNQMSHYAPIASYARQLLQRFPSSVVARMLSDAGYPVTKILGQEYDYMNRDRDAQ